MKRSDLMLEVNRVLDNPDIPADVKRLIINMHHNIEEAYRVAFTLEGCKEDTALDKGLLQIGEELRRQLES